MQGHSELRLLLVNERNARRRRYAARTRLADQASRRARPALRQRVGRQIVQIGARIAAEPSLKPARSA